MSCHPGYGHLHPLLPLIEAYRSAGWEILVATGRDLVPVARRHGLAARATGPSADEIEKTFLADRPDVAGLPPEQRLGTVLPGMFVDVAARRRMPALARLIDSWTPDLLLHDITEFAAPIAAARAGIPHIAHGVGLMRPTVGVWQQVAGALERLAADWGIPDGAHAVLDAPFVDICPPPLRGPEPLAFRESELLRPTPVPVAAEDVLPTELQDLPYARTVHVTLGTVVNTTPGLLARLVTALRDEPVNLVVATGPDLDPATLGPQPPHVLVARYLPHSWLLPRCDAVVSHAGAGTLLASLAHSLPSVLVPVGAEQVVNARIAAATGAAVHVDAVEADAAALQQAVRSVLGEPRFPAAAAGIATAIAAMPTADELRALLSAGVRAAAYPR